MSFWDNIERGLAGFSILGTVQEAFEQNNAANQQLKQIQLQSDQATLQYQQRKIANYSNTQKILNSQLVAASARGYALSSPSFNALQRYTFNTGAKAQRNLNTEQALQQEGIDFERKQVKQKLYADYFSDAQDMAKNIAEVAAAM